MEIGWLVAGIIYGIILGWIIFEYYKAPLVDKDERIIKPKK